ncbi:MAG TPA: histidine phosphatase family protein [Acidimicrobiales bacterium]|nr:histidine phosphatase family protein [Acidimicrobiales bacterium]
MPTPPTGRAGRPKPPPPTLVIFVRHGTTPSTGQVLPGRAPGLHLSDFGRQQASQVAERLATWVASGAAPNPAAEPAPKGAGRSPRRAPGGPKRPIVAAVYTSPLERTRETAAPIARQLGLKPKVERSLLECDFGAWTGAALKDLVKRPEWSTVQRYPSGFQFPEGESFVGMQRRMIEGVNAICRRHRGEAVIAVSHADPIKALVADALGTHLDLFQRIVISPCSVTAISYGPSGPSVLAVNSTGSLGELRPS